MTNCLIQSDSKAMGKETIVFFSLRISQWSFLCEIKVFSSTSPRIHLEES